VRETRGRIDTVAIKILSQFASVPGADRFEREAKALFGLNHPTSACCMLLATRRDRYLVMECVEGETLAKRLERGRCRWSRSEVCGQQIAAALDKEIVRGLRTGDLSLETSC